MVGAPRLTGALQCLHHAMFDTLDDVRSDIAKRPDTGASDRFSAFHLPRSRRGRRCADWLRASIGTAGRCASIPMRAPESGGDRERGARRRLFYDQGEDPIRCRNRTHRTIRSDRGGGMGRGEQFRPRCYLGDGPGRLRRADQWAARTLRGRGAERGRVAARPRSFRRVVDGNRRSGQFIRE